MSPQITFTPGNPHTFVATRSFDLGATNGLKLSRADEIQFDGTQLILSGHPPVAMPQIRGAIKAGWLVLKEDYQSDDFSAMRPKSAGVQMRPAEGGNPLEQKARTTVTTTTVEDEEREVSNVQDHATATKSRNDNYYTKDPSSAAVVEDQDGIPVRSIKTPAKQRTNFEKVSAYEATRQANSVRIEPGKGRSREEMMAQMSPEQRAQYEAEIMSRKAIHDPEAAMVVGHVSAPGSQEREGMKVEGSVGGGVEIADMGGTGGQTTITETISEGIKMVNTNGPGTVKRAEAPAAAAPMNTNQARAIARAICPDFPEDYHFEATPRKKVARLLADYEDRPDVIRAVAAADTDPEVRNRLFQEFPEAFQS